MKEYHKNLGMELLRIYFVTAVCLHHFRLYSNALPYGGGYLAVDFFFMTSGFYLLRHYKKSRAEDVCFDIWNYVSGRYRRLFLDYFLAFAAAFLLRYCFFRETISGAVLGYFREAFMIEFFCLPIAERINPPDWYCGYLLLASVFLYGVLSLCGKYLKTGCYFVISIILYLLLFRHSKYLNLYPQMGAVLNIAAFIRALAGMLMGMFIYCSGSCFENRIFRKRKMCLFLTGLLLVISYIIFWENFFPYADYFAVVLFVPLLFITSHFELEFKNDFLKKLIGIAGENTYIAYLNHYIVAYFFAQGMWFREWDWKLTSLLYLVGVVLFSVIMFYVKKAVLRLCRNEG